MATRLITGATDGIGRALAWRWRGRGEAPFLHGRRPVETLLADDPAGRALFEGRYVAADLARADAPDRIARFLRDSGVGALDTLVLNAACGFVGDLGEQDPEEARALLQVDLTAGLHLSHCLLPMLLRARGRIVFVSSIVAQLASPRYALYAAAKNAVEGFLRSLRIELEGRVQIQVLRLGAVQTRLHEKSGLARETLPWERSPSAERVAESIDRFVLSGSAAWRAIGVGNRLSFGVARAWPTAIDRFRREGAASVPERANRGGVRRCLVTGASGGIGAALVRRFHRAGFDLVGVDRDGPMPGGPPLEFLPCDLADPKAVRKLAAELVDRGPFDVVIHCAGLNRVGRFESAPWGETRALIEVNVVAPVILTMALLRAGDPAPDFVFVSSLSRFVSYPGAAVYAATKDGLAHFARSLRARQAPRGGAVLTVYPGPTRTEHARRHSPDNSREHRRMLPEVLAERVLRAFLARRSVLVPGLSNGVSALLGHVLPRVTERVMRGAILERLQR